MLDKIFNKYGREKVKDKTLNYEDIQKLLYSRDVEIDCKLESYNDFEKILDSLDKDQNIDLKLEYIGDNPDENTLRNFKGLGPKFVSNIAYNHLKPVENEKEYFDANYRISTKKKSYKHHMEIEAGERETENKNITKKKKATLEWKISK